MNRAHPLRSIYHFFAALVAALVHNFPSRHLIVIGVTGTNGKTTVVHLLHEIFRAAGYGVGSISSLRFKINDSEEKNTLKMTMPGRGWLQRFLARSHKAGCRFVILEVTSEGIKQHRHRFIRFSAAVLTNVAPEHIEAHGGFEHYLAAKTKLFRLLTPSGLAILNREDSASRDLAKATAAKVVWYSRLTIETENRVYAVNIRSINREGVALDVGGMVLEAPLGGAFNAMNIIAASATALATGLSLKDIRHGLLAVRGVPGRLEFIQKKPFAAVVDYAHTPDALEKVYSALGNNLICVFSAAGGGRDKWKRSAMGQVASRYCRDVVLTSEDPDDEDAGQIVSQIQSGMTHERLLATKVVLDRREAIRAALGIAQTGDTVIITGMGAQPWFIEKGRKIPWDERQIVREELAKLKT